MSATRGHFFCFVQFDGGIFPDKFCHVRENDNGRRGADQNRPRLPECAPSAARSQTETGIYTDQQRENAIQGTPGAAGDINTHHAQVIHYTPHTQILGVESAPRVMYNRNRNTTPNTAQEEKTNV